MRKTRLDDLRIISETSITGDPLTETTLKVKDKDVNLIFRNFYIDSEPGGKGTMMLRFGEFEMVDLYKGAQLNSARNSYLAHFRKKINSISPSGVTAVVCSQFRYRSGRPYVEFRARISFAVDHKKRESFVEAAVRIYGIYLDLFQICREKARPSKFNHEVYVMVAPPKGGKRKKTLVEDYILTKEGFDLKD